MTRHNLLKEKMREAAASVLPIAAIVALLCLFLVPVNNGLFLSFAVGTGLIIIGMAFFTIGSEIAMTQIGNHIGARMTKTKKLWLIVLLSLALGIAVTVAEPDLQVLATNAPSVDTLVLIVTVSVGVGLFLAVSMLRILFLRGPKIISIQTAEKGAADSQAAFA